jgi:hypothetical protein
MYTQTCAYISSGIIGILLGEQWDSLSDQEKQPYKENAEADKERDKDWDERNMGSMVARRVYAAARSADCTYW